MTRIVLSSRCNPPGSFLYAQGNEQTQERNTGRDVQYVGEIGKVIMIDLKPVCHRCIRGDFHHPTHHGKNGIKSIITCLFTPSSRRGCGRHVRKAHHPTHKCSEYANAEEYGKITKIRHVEPGDESDTREMYENSTKRYAPTDFTNIPLRFTANKRREDTDTSTRGFHEIQRHGLQMYRAEQEIDQRTTPARYCGEEGHEYHQRMG